MCVLLQLCGSDSSSLVNSIKFFHCVLHVNHRPLPDVQHHTVQTLTVLVKTFGHTGPSQGIEWERVQTSDWQSDRSCSIPLFTMNCSVLYSCSCSRRSTVLAVCIFKLVKDFNVCLFMFKIMLVFDELKATKHNLVVHVHNDNKEPLNTQRCRWAWG